MTGYTPAELAIQIQNLREAITLLSSELADAWTRIGELETRLHDHEQAVPHQEAVA